MNKLATFFSIILGGVLVFAFTTRDDVYAQVSPPANYKVAFIGDSGYGSNFRSVLQLISQEGAQLVLHQGDFDYSYRADDFFAVIDSELGSSFPYLGSVGNHDDSSWNEGCSDSDGCYAEFFKQRMTIMGISPDDPDLNDQMYSVVFNGLKVVFVGQDGSSAGDNVYAPYINAQLQNDDHIWKICSFHKNQNALQLGTKSNEMGWNVFENCKNNAAIIAMGHEHSYSRTKTLSDFQNQIVDSQFSEPSPVAVGSGRSFSFVSGIGGIGIRNQDRCLPTTYPYGCNQEWAKIYTSDQNADYGALFITFNVDGDPTKAHGYFKNVNNEIIDEFDIINTEYGSFTPTPTSIYSPTPTPTHTPTSTPTPTPVGQSTVDPIDDAFIHQDQASQNFGSSTRLEVDGSPVKNILMKFDLRGASSSTLQTAILKLYVIDSSSSTQSVRVISDNSWTEDTITYNTRPAEGAQITTLSGGTSGSWIEIDVTEHARNSAGDFMSIQMSSSGSNGLDFNSKEASSNTPYLLISESGGGYLDADINEDGIVDLRDYSILVRNFFSESPDVPRADINGDGIVDLRDYSLLVSQFFQTSS